MTRNRTERGAIGGIEGLAFGILIFAFGTFMVLNAWAVVDGSMAASAAAREATRAYVESASSTDGETAATTAAENAMAGHSHLSTSVSITPVDSFQRCEPVTATVRVEVPRVSLPLIGEAGGVIAVHGSHTEVIDPYRSGLSGAVNCE